MESNQELSATDSPQSTSLGEKDEMRKRLEDRLANPQNYPKDRYPIAIKAGFELLQDICGENAYKSGWHKDRPVQGIMTTDDGAEYFYDESNLQFNDRLRNWQIAKIMLMVSELSEGVEELRKGHKAHHTYYSGEERKPEGLPSELADCLIRILDFCYTEKIELIDMILEKLTFNQSRGIKHGGKAI